MLAARETVRYCAAGSPFSLRCKVHRQSSPFLRTTLPDIRIRASSLLARIHASTSQETWNISCNPKMTSEHFSRSETRNSRSQSSRKVIDDLLETCAETRGETKIEWNAQKLRFSYVTWVQFFFFILGRYFSSLLVDENTFF